jgi:hypothetical protein
LGDSPASIGVDWCGKITTFGEKAVLNKKENGEVSFFFAEIHAETNLNRALFGQSDRVLVLTQRRSRQSDGVLSHNPVY